MTEEIENKDTTGAKQKTAPNPIVGYWKCERGGRASVTQTRKRGRHFNTSCDCCGFVQGTGKARQQDIWDNAEFEPGLTVACPSNVSSDKAKSKPKPEPKEATDFNPNESESTEESTELVEAETSGRGKLVAGALLLLSAGVGLWLG